MAASGECLPGLVVSPARAHHSVFSCLRRTFVVVASLVFTVTLASSLFAVYSSARAAQSPHRALLANSSAPDLPVVRPLFDRNQAFDIVVSVYVSPTEEVIAANREARLAASPEAVVDLPEDRFGVRQWAEYEMDAIEEPLFSEVVFRGLKLSDRGMKAVVNFTVPTARFCGKRLTPNDLRGSFVLIPSSPSPLDSLKNLSHYIPSSIYRPPRRNWPSPSERTLADQAVDAFAVNIPLVQFRNASWFQSLGSTTVEHVQHDDSSEASPLFPTGVAIDSDDDVEDDAPPPASELGGADRREQMAATERAALDSLVIKESPVHVEPYIVTRTELRIIDDVSVYDLKQFNARHNVLKRTSCGQKDSADGVIPNRRFCDKDFTSTGPFETRMLLENGQRLYSPFLIPSPKAAGYLDWQKIPVDRSSLRSAEDGDRATCRTSESMDISWHISVSGRSPLFHRAGDLFLKFWTPQTEDPVLSAHDQVKAQTVSELMNAVAGHVFYDDARPRLRILHAILTTIDLPLAWALQCRYWYTRRTTTGLSLWANRATAVGVLLPNIYRVGKDVLRVHWTESLFGLALLLVFALPSWLQLLAITRAELGWNGWLPTLHIRDPTLEESLSEEMASLDAPSMLSTLDGVVCLLYGLLQPVNIVLLRGNLPRQDPSSITPEDRRFPILTAALFTFALSQLILNYRLRLFAGLHRADVVLNFGTQLFKFGLMFDVISGRFDARERWSLDDAIALALATAWFVQACIYPEPDQVLAHIETEREEEKEKVE